MLNGHVLVLNKSWVAVNITSSRRAMTLLYLGWAQAVHPTDYSLHDFESWIELPQEGLGGRYIHTPTLRVRIPEVVHLIGFNQFIRHEVRFSRGSIFERDKNVCQYCGKHFAKSQLTLDHVMPQSRQGDDSWENLVVACLPCNVRKGNRTPEEAGMPLMHHPQKPKWIPHFGARVPHEQLVIWRKFVDSRYFAIRSAESA